MSLDADLIVDRRRMRRKLTFWRVVTVLVAIVAVVGAGVVFTGRRGAIVRRPRRDASPGSTSKGLIRGNRQRVEALDRLAQVERQGGDRAHQQPGRHRGRLRGALRFADQAEGQEADGGGGGRARGLRRLYRRAGVRPHPGAAERHRRLDRRHLPVSQRHRASEDDRRAGRKHQILAAQGRAQRLRADEPRGARRRRGAS